MAKKILIPVMIVIAVIAVVFGAACFITWGTHPSKWDEFGRAMVAFIIIAFSGLSLSIYHNEIS